jgi:tetratricopeptide (TPR) repeat protein
MRSTTKNPELVLAEAQRLTDEAGVHWNDGSYPKTEVLCRQALKLTRSAAGDRDPRVAERLYNLATLYHFQRRFDEAKPLFQESILIHEAQAETDGKALAFCYAWLARTLFEAWRDDPEIDGEDEGRSFGEAEACYRRAISLLQSNDAVTTAEYSACLVQLAFLFYFCERFVEAEPLLCEAIKLRESLFGPDHLETAEPVGRLALLYWQDEALQQDPEPLLRRSLEIRRAELPANDADVIEWTYRLAQFCLAGGNAGEAQELLGRVSTLLLDPQTVEEPKLEWIVAGCVDYWMESGRDDRAAEVNARWNRESSGLRAKRHEAHRRAMMFGADHPRVADALCEVADHLRFDENYDDALELYERALAIRERADGPESPTITPILNGIATLRRALGEMEAARIVLQRAAVIPFALDSASERREHARIIEQLAWVESAEDEADRSEALFQEALALVENPVGFDDREAAEMRFRYAIHCEQESRFIDAEASLQSALEYAARTGEIDALEIADYREQYASILTSLGREPEAAEQLALVEEIWARHGALSDLS